MSKSERPRKLPSKGGGRTRDEGYGIMLPTTPPTVLTFVAALERKHASVNEAAPPKLNVLTARACS